MQSYKTKTLLSMHVGFGAQGGGDDRGRGWVGCTHEQSLSRGKKSLVLRLSLLLNLWERRMEREGGGRSVVWFVVCCGWDRG